ncbi:MAG TPA: AsmA-like C-terminal region-containing protein [Puia sp.]|uniref:AsmA family protein n=1 Tax=Puia sp. TaxID=2045100 RepID=UPI002C93B0F3|nr:AsmA-like C-terminal region-containing protein [Puia sp.]HVU97284.1 AsmA-like C-terminal region-containing protein [Puia sp.]
MRILLRVLKIAGITTGSLLLILFLLPYLFPRFVSNKIRQWARHSIQSELHFKQARLSFFRHFPALTLTLYDVRLNGSAPFAKERLIEADEIALGVDLRSVFSEVRINKLFLTNAFINIQVDTAGHSNYNIYTSPKSNSSVPADSTGASLKIEKIIIEHSRLTYNDASLPLLINTRGLEYEGNGDLSKAIFDLHSHIQLESIDFYYRRTPYFINKKLNADLITKINTNSLELIFERNDLLINQLPVAFTGQFSFLKDGYDMDFRLNAKEAQLRDIFTALPPEMLTWLDSTEVKGTGDIDAALKGRYIAASNTMPDFLLNLQIRNGYIAYAKAPAPIHDLRVDWQCRLPGLQPDSLDLRLDTISFRLDKDYFDAALRVKGLAAPWVSATVRSEMDLGKWDRALGFAPADLRGRYSLRLNAEGRYATRVERVTTLRKTRLDTVVASIPHFTLTSALRNGYYKLPSRPEAINEINFDLDASCNSDDYHRTRIAVDNINARVLGSYLKGFFHLDNASDYSMAGSLETVLHLADLRKVIPIDSLELSGDLSAHVRARGNYLPAKHRFPVTEADLQLNNGRIQTKYYPHPLEQIQVGVRMTSKAGSMKDLQVAITPVFLVFEGEPFTLKADLQNFTDLNYSLNSRGSLDLGRIGKVFALKDYDISGLVDTRLTLRGRQSDATAGRYDRLFNEGTLRVRNLMVRSELFPLPFYINTGNFHFEQDKMWFDAFNGSYGKTRFALNGWLSDVFGYMSRTGQPLKGNFTVNSDHLYADEFTAFAGMAPSSAPATPGVILVPTDLSVGFHADVKRIDYNGLCIDSFSGGVRVDSGTLHLDTTAFRLAGAAVRMTALYKSVDAQRALFDYRLVAKDFDVHRAYREVKLFHDMAASAAKAEGLISLDYKLAGRLDGNMRPVYPSLKGGGTLSIRKVKVKGLRLFGEVSKQTNKDVNDPELSKVDIKSTIANNLMTIERTRMKVSVFKLRIEGQTSFDGRLNLHVRVGLPPFGIIGIPVYVGGTQDDPIVKVSRGKNGQLQETEDKDEEGQGNL